MIMQAVAGPLRVLRLIAASLRTAVSEGGETPEGPVPTCEVSRPGTEADAKDATPWTDNATDVWSIKKVSPAKLRPAKKSPPSSPSDYTLRQPHWLNCDGKEGKVGPSCYE